MPEETPKPQTPTAIDGPIPDWQRQLTKSVAARRGLRLDVANAKELYRHLFTAEPSAASRGPQNEKCDYRHTNRVQPMRCEYRKGHTGHHSLVNDYEQPDNEECDHGHRLYEGIGCRKCFHNALKGAMEQAERGCAAHIEAGAPFSPCPSIHHCFVCEALRKIKMASSKCVCGHDDLTHRVQVGSAPDKIFKGCYICADCKEFKANASRVPEETPSCPLCGSVEANVFLGICAAYHGKNEPAHVFHWATTSPELRAKMRYLPEKWANSHGLNVANRHVDDLVFANWLGWQAHAEELAEAREELAGVREELERTKAELERHKS